MINHSLYRTNKCHHLWHLFIIIIFIIIIFTQKSFTQAIGRVGVGIINSDGKVDTIGTGTQPQFAYELCEGACFQVISLDFTLDPTQAILEDTIIWEFQTGLPKISMENSPSICFPIITTLEIVTLHRFVTNFPSGQPSFKSWYTETFYLIVKKCPPEAFFIQDKEIVCQNNFVQFSDSPFRHPDEWEWKFEGGKPSFWSGRNPPCIEYNIPGIYQVSLSVKNDQGIDTLIKYNTIEVFKAPIKQDGIETHFVGMYGRDTLINSCVKGDIYKWKPSEGLSCDDCEQPILRFGAIKQYLCIVSVENGVCSDSCIVNIRTEMELPKIFFPNVISPNYDGINDIFEGSWSNAEIQELHIYDRWGGVKYSSNSNFTWDATYKGQEVDNGVYVYYVVYKNNFTGSKEVKSGSVTVAK